MWSSISSSRNYVVNYVVKYLVIWKISRYVIKYHVIWKLCGQISRHLKIMWSIMSSSISSSEKYLVMWSSITSSGNYVVKYLVISKLCGQLCRQVSRHLKNISVCDQVSRHLKIMWSIMWSNITLSEHYCCNYLVRGGTETNRQCFADICKSRQSRFGSKSRIYCRNDALKNINTAQRHLDNKHRQLILPICTRIIANLTLQTLADIGKALPISLCAAPYVSRHVGISSSSHDPAGPR